jgi:hypothetical protein
MQRTSFNTFEDITEYVNRSTVFSPEQKRAICILIDSLPNRTQITKNTVELSDLIIENNRFFTNLSLFPPQLPREPSWQWNQSRSKSHFEFGTMLDGTFCKLIPRKIHPHIKAPSYKIWAIEFKLFQYENCNFVWCERGITQVPNLSPPQNPETEIAQPSRSQRNSEDLGSGNVPDEKDVDVAFDGVSLYEFLESHTEPSWLEQLISKITDDQ